MNRETSHFPYAFLTLWICRDRTTGKTGRAGPCVLYWILRGKKWTLSLSKLASFSDSLLINFIIHCFDCRPYKKTGLEAVLTIRYR